ncbi:hypothetical protein L218DRAFT_728241 [Marasmius fiardii PR-910]|nr:hypothetical protein L218DRAFT_728241 [Marasmius fiardii PR-910]
MRITTKGPSNFLFHKWRIRAGPTAPTVVQREPENELRTKKIRARVQSSAPHWTHYFSDSHPPLTFQPHEGDWATEYRHIPRNILSTYDVHRIPSPVTQIKHEWIFVVNICGTWKGQMFIIALTPVHNSIMIRYTEIERKSRVGLDEKLLAGRGSTTHKQNECVATGDGRELIDVAHSFTPLVMFLSWP